MRELCCLLQNIDPTEKPAWLAEGNDPAGRVLLMMVAKDGVPYRYRLAEPRATKPVVESEHQLLGMLADLPL